MPPRWGYFVISMQRATLQATTEINAKSMTEKAKRRERLHATSFCNIAQYSARAGASLPAMGMRVTGLQVLHDGPATGAAPRRWQGSGPSAAAWPCEVEAPSPRFELCPKSQASRSLHGNSGLDASLASPRGAGGGIQLAGVCSGRGSAGPQVEAGQKLFRSCRKTRVALDCRLCFSPMMQKYVRTGPAQAVEQAPLGYEGCALAVSTASPPDCLPVTNASCALITVGIPLAKWDAHLLGLLLGWSWHRLRWASCMGRGTSL